MKKIKIIKIMNMLPVLILTACTVANSEQSPTNNTTVENISQIPSVEVFQAEDNITISLASFVQEDTIFGDAYLERIEAFEAQNPTIEIEHFYDATEIYKVTVESDFKTHNEVDILLCLTDGILDNIPQEKFATVADIRFEYPFFATHINSEVFNNFVDEYLVPIAGYYKGLYYNTILFEQYELEAPTSWSNLTKAIEVLSENDIIPISISFDGTSKYLLEHLLLSVAGEGILEQSKTQERNMWSNANIIFEELYRANAFSSNALTQTVEDSLEEFYNQNAAMIIEGNWLQQSSYPEWAKLTSIPYIDGQNNRYIANFDMGFYVTNKGFSDENKKYAINEFINFMTSTESLKIFQTATSGINPSDLTKNESYELITSPILTKTENEWTAILDSMVDIITYIEENPEILEDDKVGN